MSKVRFFSPMLCTLTKEAFDDSNWIFEDKFDGVRAVAVKKGKKVQLFSRNKKNLNSSFPEIVKELEKINHDFVIDGELVVFEGKVTSFSKLQPRIQRKRNLKDSLKVYYYVFDLLVMDDIDYRKQPLIERKLKLKSKFKFSSKVKYTQHKSTKGFQYYQTAQRKGLEGIVAKEKESLYVSRRSNSWRKIKCMNSCELVIGGYTAPKGKRKGFGALLVGYYKKGALIFAGKVGTGGDEKSLIALERKLSKLKRASSPFSNYQVKNESIFYVTPKLIAQIQFTEWTKDNKLRHPSFLGIRTDKNPKKIERESYGKS